MTSSRRLTIGVTWNLLGQLIPLVVAVATVPVLIQKMGTERFGLLTFAWMIVGYSSMLDLGIGRALTQNIAERLGRGAHDEIPGIIQVGLGVMMTMGLIAATGLFATSSWIVNHFLKLSPGLLPEAHWALPLLSLAVPLVILGAALRGILEAYQQFRELNIIRTIIGLSLYLSPLPILGITRNIGFVIGALVCVRAFEIVLLVIYCFRLVPNLNIRPRLLGDHFKPLVKFGLWSSVNNLVGSLMAMAYIDRLFISYLIGTSALAFFATPFDVVARILIVPGAIMGVLFPVLSHLGQTGTQDAADLSGKAIRLVAFALAPVCLFLTAGAFPLLRLWLGFDFATRSAHSLQLFALGTMAVSIAYVPFAFVQAMGRPDLTAKRHILELPFYFVFSYFAIRTFGNIGAAVVWSTWAVIDLVLMNRIFRRELGKSGFSERSNSWSGLCVIFGLTAGIGYLGPTWAQTTAAVLAPSTFLYWGWKRWLSLEDRVQLCGFLPPGLRVWFSEGGAKA